MYNFFGMIEAAFTTGPPSILDAFRYRVSQALIQHHRPVTPSAEQGFVFKSTMVSEAFCTPRNSSTCSVDCFHFSS